MRIGEYPVWFWLFRFVLIGPAFGRWLNITVTGADKIPDKGPVIIASNHLAECDSFLIPWSLTRPTTYLAKASYFNTKSLLGRLVRWFMVAVGQIPVDRDKGDTAALDAAMEVLEAGHIWAMYPEGTRSPDGRLYRGRTGLMRGAERFGEVPIFPIGIVGSNVVNPPDGHKLHRGNVEVHIGDPLISTEVIGRLGVRGATDELMRRIAELSGQEYVDEYARRRKSDD